MNFFEKRLAELRKTLPEEEALKIARAELQEKVNDIRAYYESDEGKEAKRKAKEAGIKAARDLIEENKIDPSILNKRMNF